jgi:hypothetical protein
MSGSNRLHHIAVRGWLIAAFCYTAGPALAQIDDYHYGYPTQNAASEETNTRSGSSFPIAQSQDENSGQTQSLCEAPKGSKESDLCQQWRMAEAAEKQLIFVGRQLNATYAEIVALVLTLVATAGAAIAAVIAARAANASVAVAKATAKRQLRAYVGLKGARLYLDENGEFSYRARYMNFGQTPAKDVVAETSCLITRLDRKYSFQSQHPAGQAKSMGVLYPGEYFQYFTEAKMPGTNSRIRLPPEYRANIAAGSAAIFLHGQITYKDIFKKRHITKFRLMYTGHWSGKCRLRVCEAGNDAT